MFQLGLQLFVYSLRRSFLLAGLSSVNSSLTDIKTTSASLVNQQSELNMTLLNISTFAHSDINSCGAPSCTTLGASLDNLHAGPPYSVSSNLLPFYFFDSSSLLRGILFSDKR